MWNSSEKFSLCILYDPAHCSKDLGPIPRELSATQNVIWILPIPFAIGQYAFSSFGIDSANMTKQIDWSMIQVYP